MAFHFFDTKTRDGFSPEFLSMSYLTPIKISFPPGQLIFRRKMPSGWPSDLLSILNLLEGGGQPLLSGPHSSKQKVGLVNCRHLGVLAVGTSPPRLTIVTKD